MTMAMDFGTCNTVLARWNAATRQVETLRPNGMTRLYRYTPPGADAERESAVVPSLIHYGEGNTLRAGAQVENAGLTHHRGTFRWVKLDLLRGNNRARRVNGELITPRQAADDLVGQVLLAAAGQNGEDLVITLPVEAYDPYVDWLQAAVLQSYRGTVRMLDEATACILGYDAHVREGQIYMVFDFGGGTLDVSVVKTLDLSGGETAKCQVLGRAGEEIGGSLVDQWLLRELQHARQLNDQDVKDVSTALLRAVEDAKIRLSNGEERVEVTQFNDLSARLISHTFTAAGLRQSLEANRPELGDRGLHQLVALTVERALETAQGKYGARKSDIKGVFMAGGSSLLLGVAGVVRNLFPGAPVHCQDPFEAIARGACRYAGEDINLALVHDYCLRSWDRERKDYVLVPVAPKGTRYPTEQPVAVKYVNAACEGATRLGLVVIERSAMVRPETVYEVVGGQLQAVQTVRRDDVALRELNPTDREFIHADPPCTVGARRFVAGFGVDANKRLTLSLKDLEPGNRSYLQLSGGERLALPVKDLPFVKL
jgi:molecular chaperone DnaK (HSP70)